jgi:hypothetical protein
MVSTVGKQNRGRQREKFAKTGDYCPNEACPGYGKLQKGQKQRNTNRYEAVPMLGLLAKVHRDIRKHLLPQAYSRT